MPDEAATLSLGAALATGAGKGRVLYLSGDLGTGKTTLVRGLLQALGHPGRVKSPTYTLVEPYVVSGLDLYHFDLYRFKDETEWLDSGFREYFNPDSLCLVEWPEKAGDLLAPPDLSVALSMKDMGREARLEAHSPQGEDWLRSLRWPPARL